MAQLMSASYGNQSFVLNAWVKADETGMDISLFNDMGAGMGELSYRDGAVAFSSSVFPAAVKPEFIIADFQLCFYDPVQLGEALAQCGLVLDIQGSNRLILEGKKVIIEIEKSPNKIKLTNHLRRYTYTLEGDFE
jgi:hypothetical protein